MKRWAVLFLAGLGLFQGCSETEKFEVTISFPDQSAKDATKTLKMYSLIPGEGATCQTLLDGTNNPGDGLCSIEDQQSIKKPFTDSIPPLKVKKDTKPRLFFSQGENDVGLVIFKGCIEVKPGGGVHQVAISLNYTYIVTFDGDGATVEANPTTKTVTLPSTTVGMLPTAPTKTGYAFGGWYTEHNGGGTEFTADTVVTASMIIFAKWTCTPETDIMFCQRLGKNCGPVTAFDNCGTSRPVASCGSCTSSQVCEAGLCMGWGAPTMLSDKIFMGDGGCGSPKPSMGVDTSGNVTIVWQQLDADVYASRYSVGGSWSPAEVVHSSQVMCLHAAMDASGNATAVWEGYDGTNWNIYSSHYVAGGSWSPSVVIDTGSSPQVAVDANGNAIAVWFESDGTHTNIHASRYTAGGTWSPSVVIDNLDYDARRPKVAMDASGNGIAVWLQSDGTHQNVYASRYAAGGSWSSPVAIDNLDYDAYLPNYTDYTPRVVMDASGNGIAVWLQSDGTHQNVYASRYVAGQSWSIPVVIDGLDTDPGFPMVAINARGDAVIVWAQSGNIYSSRYVGNAWSTPELVDILSYQAWGPVAAMDANGNAMVVWVQSNGTRYAVYGSRYIEGSSWSNPVVIDNLNDDVYDVAMTMNAEGRASAAWLYQPQPGNGSLYVGYYGP